VIRKVNPVKDIGFYRVRCRLLVVLLLVVLTAGVYAPVLDSEFVTYDDDLYVTANDQVRQGLTREGIRWAFDFNEAVYWHPLTWLSHMLDVEIFGLNSGMHHAMNLLFHIANTVLLFWILRLMTGAYWRSAAVACLFGLHPLNVESVAWVASRKNLLSTAFWMLTILTYLYYCRKPNLRRYGGCLTIFLLGLMFKPMLVTLPFVLLLLDYWPLQRIRSPHRLHLTPSRFEKSADLKELILEKIPFLMLSLIIVYLYGASVKHLDIVVGVETAPMTLRIFNALVSYWAYIRQMFFPVQLTFFYPYPIKIPLWQVIAAAVSLSAVTFFALRWMRKWPFLFTGWFWYFGTLVPTLGLMQAGRWPATADRFAYVPMIGLFVVLTWGAAGWVRRWNLNKVAVAGVGMVLLVLLAASTRRQVEFWQHDVSLYKRAIAVTDNNQLAHKNLGNAYLRNGQVQQAIAHYETCLRIDPADSTIYNNLAAAMIQMDQLDEAVAYLKKALQLDPGYVQAENNLIKILVFRELRIGKALEEKGELQAAIEHYQEFLSRFPDIAVAHYRIAVILGRSGQVDQSVEWLQRALQKGFRNWQAIRSSEHLREVRNTALFRKLEQAHRARSS
jgi:tetratricopeptide (TPR) repeat protein